MSIWTRADALAAAERHRVACRYADDHCSAPRVAPAVAAGARVATPARPLRQGLYFRATRVVRVFLAALAGADDASSMASQSVRATSPISAYGQASTISSRGTRQVASAQRRQGRVVLVTIDRRAAWSVR